MRDGDVFDNFFITFQVYISTRAGAYVTTRLSSGGLPYDFGFTRRFVNLVPSSIKELKLKRRINDRLDHAIHALKPKHGVLEAGIVINDEIHYQIVNGNIVIKTDVKRSTKTGVEFADGTTEEIDRVILATGYDITFPIDKEVVSADNCQARLYRYTFPPDLVHPTLAIIGLTSHLGTINAVAELQSRWCARLIKGIGKLPSKDHMTQDIDRRKRGLKKNFRQTRTLPTGVDFIPFLDELAAEINWRKTQFMEDAV